MLCERRAHALLGLWRDVEQRFAHVAARLVEEAQESKAPTERFIDRFSRYYTPGVVVVAFLVAVAPPLLFGGVYGESLRVKLWANATLTDGFCELLSEALGLRVYC